MDSTTAVSPHSSLTALRGAVGGVMRAGDALGRWDRMVSLWHIFCALDALMAVLWSFVQRVRTGEMPIDGPRCAGALGCERQGAARSGLARVASRQRTPLRRPSGLRTMRLTPAVSGIGAMVGWDAISGDRSVPGCPRASWNAVPIFKPRAERPSKHALIVPVHQCIQINPLIIRHREDLQTA